MQLQLGGKTKLSLILFASRLYVTAFLKLGKHIIPRKQLQLDYHNPS